MPTTYKVLGQVATTTSTQVINGRALSGSIASITTAADHNAVIGQPVTIASVIASNTVTSRQRSASVASLTIGTHSFVVGQSIVVAGVSDTSFNGTYNISGATSTVVAYTNNAASVSACAQSSGSVTGLDPAFNGTYTVLTTPTSRMLTYQSPSTVTYASAANSGSATNSPWNLAYTASTGVSAVTSTLTVTNRSSTNPASYQVAVSTSSVTPANKDFIVYNDLIATNDTVAMTIGLTVDSTNKYLMFAGSHGSLSFNVFGAEIT